jgi:hypothetical protein
MIRSTTPWLDAATAEIGVMEVPGEGNKPRIRAKRRYGERAGPLATVHPAGGDLLDQPSPLVGPAPPSEYPRSSQSWRA